MSEPLVQTAAAETSIVALTPAAVAQVRFLIRKQDNPNLKLRIGVKGGGCSGLSYVLNLEAEPTERDMVFEIDGLTVLVDRKSARFVAGLTLDYSTQNLLEGGWKYINPNAQRSCGCGTSFTPK
jgi:iron-sulfur cluster assembly protein